VPVGGSGGFADGDKNCGAEFELEGGVRGAVVGITEEAEGFETEDAAGVDRVGGDGDVGVNEGAFAVGGPGNDLGGAGVERDAGVCAGTGAEEVRDVQRAVGGGNVDAEGFSAGEEWERDCVVASVEQE